MEKNKKNVIKKIKFIWLLIFLLNWFLCTVVQDKLGKIPSFGSTWLIQQIINLIKITGPGLG